METEMDRLHEELREVRQDLADAVDDVERLLWLSGLCQWPLFVRKSKNEIFKKAPGAKNQQKRGKAAKNG